MRRIKIYLNEGESKREFGGFYIHWLVEDCDNCFWVISSKDSRIQEYEKPKYSWEQE